MPVISSSGPLLTGGDQWVRSVPISASGAPGLGLCVGGSTPCVTMHGEFDYKNLKMIMIFPVHGLGVRVVGSRYAHSHLSTLCTGTAVLLLLIMIPPFY